MSYFICFLFSIFIALSLGFLKLHGHIDLSWFSISMLTLFWEIPVLIGTVLAGVGVGIALCLLVSPILLGVGLYLLIKKLWRSCSED